MTKNTVIPEIILNKLPIQSFSWFCIVLVVYRDFQFGFKLSLQQISPKSVQRFSRKNVPDQQKDFRFYNISIG